ncbi:MFS transporter [Francisellaceae bacterium]|nr:MFS transporter [Francisellaceae bacterium]
MSNETAKSQSIAIVPLLLLCLIQFGTMFDNAMLANSLSSITVSFHTSLAKIQMANMVYPLLCASVMIISGFVGMNIGWKKILIIGLAVICAGELIAFASPDFAVFTYGGRVLAGIGGGICIPGVLGYITANFTKKNQALAFGAIAAIAAVGSAVAPVISGFIIVFSNWKIGFLLLGVLFLILLVGGLFFLKGNIVKNEKTHFDYIGAILLFIGVSLFLFGLSIISSWGLITPTAAPFTVLDMSPSLFVIGLGLVFIIICIYYEHSKEKKLTSIYVLLPKEFLQNREIRSGILMSAFVFLTLGALNFVLVLYMQTVLDKNAIITGLYLTVFAAGMSITSLFTSAVAQSFSPKSICQFGIILTAFACGFILFGIVKQDVNGLFYIGLFLIGLGCGLVASQASFAVTSAIDDNNLASKSSGIQGASRNFGQAIGVAIVGLVIMFGLAQSVKDQILTNDKLSSNLKSHINLMPNIPFVSNNQLSKEMNKAHIKNEQKQALLAINEKARLIALRSSFIVMILFCMVFFFFSFGVISKKISELKT